MNREDWALLVLASAKGEPLSPAQFQKSLFILGKGLSDDIGEEDFYNFIPYDYGPFDASIYSDAEDLVMEGFAIIRSAPGQRWDEYSATPAGLERAEALRADLPKYVEEYLDVVVEWVRSLSFVELIKAIYKEFPKYAVNSVFLEQE